MSYKNLLLKPNKAAIERTLLGQSVYIRRLTAQEMLDYNACIDAERAGDNDSTKLANMGIELILSVLMNPDGNRPEKDELPTPAEILRVHSQADILDALTTVQRHSYGTLEAAEKN